MSSTTERITNCSVYTFADELIVELTGEDEDGIITALSYQFDYEPGCADVQAKGSVDPEYVQYVHEGLEDQGFNWVDGPGS